MGSAPSTHDGGGGNGGGGNGGNGDGGGRRDSFPAKSFRESAGVTEGSFKVTEYSSKKRRFFEKENKDKGSSFGIQVQEAFKGRSHMPLSEISDVLRLKFNMHLSEEELCQPPYELGKNKQGATVNDILKLLLELHKAPLFAEIFAMATLSDENWEQFATSGLVLPPSPKIFPRFEYSEDADVDISSPHPSSAPMPPKPQDGLTFVEYLFSDANNVQKALTKEQIGPNIDLPISMYFARSCGNDFINCANAEEVIQHVADNVKSGGRSFYMDCWDETNMQTGLAFTTPEMDAEGLVLNTVSKNATVKEADGSEIYVFQGCLEHLSDSEKKKITLAKVLEGLKVIPPTRLQDGSMVVLPIFLSISFCCTLGNQNKICEILKEAFGEKVQQSAPKISEINDRDNLPSLRSLQGKVILMTSSVDYSKLDPVSSSVEELFTFKATEPNEFFDMIEEGQAFLPPGQLAHLTALDVCAYTGILEQLATTRLMQVRFERMAQDGTVLSTCNIASSGFNPLRAWRYGVQFVPLDNLGLQESAWMQHMLFQSNGGCGYALKEKKPKSQGLVFQLHATVLAIKQVPKLTKDTSPYLKVSFDAGTGSQQVAISTTQPADNGLFCLWNETFSFKITSLFPMQSLVFVVRDRDSINNDDLAWGAIQISQLNPGTRCVQLYTPDCQKIEGGKLLAHFQFEKEEPY